MLEVRLKKTRGSFQLDVEFTMSKPGVVVLFGPSGCGKSTLIRLLAGLETADSGLIRLDSDCYLDSDRGQALAAELRGIGCVFQDPRLFPHMSVRANLQYGTRRSTRRAYVGFDEIIEVLNLAALLDRRPTHLSGGEKQRVAIGRALLSQPRLVLLDEPLAHLDTARREEVLPYLEILRDRVAIPMVFVTHRFDEALRLATQLLLMREGKVLAFGGVEQLSVSAELRSMLGGDQIGAVVTGEFLQVDPLSGLAVLRVGDGQINVPGQAAAAGVCARFQLLARDVIVATEPPAHLSVRNMLRGRISAITAEHAGSDLVSIDIGRGDVILARITSAATRELQLCCGLRVWALIKAVSMQGHHFAAPTPPDRFRGAEA